MFVRKGQGLGSILYKDLPQPQAETQPKRKPGRPRKQFATAGETKQAESAPSSVTGGISTVTLSKPAEETRAETSPTKPAESKDEA